MWDWELTDRDRRCGRKIQYDVWIDAFEVNVDHYEENRSVLVPYRCRYCRYIHNGGQPKGDTGANWRTARARLEKARRKRAARRELRAREREREQTGNGGRAGRAGTGRGGAPDRAAAPPGPAPPG